MAIPIPRRRVEELIFLHEHEPSIHDVFVEGASDRAIVMFFLKETGFESVNVYPIDAIDLGDEAQEITGGNRGRVVRLAQILATSLEDALCSFTCIVDRDLDGVLDREPLEISCLLYTDFTCMDMYFFNESALGKCLTLTWRHDDLSGRQVMDALTPVLRSQFGLRASIEQLSLQISLINKVSCVSLDCGSVVLDLDEYIRRVANKGQVSDRCDELKERVSAFVTEMPQDVRHSSHGRDVIQLLAWFLRQAGVNSEHLSYEVLRHSLVLTLTVEELQEYELFIRLSDRVRAASSEG